MKVKLLSFSRLSVLECQPSLNTVMSTSHNMLEAIYGPQFDNHLLDELREVFPPREPTPTDTVSLIMYTAGQQSVIDWLIKRMEDER
jgi:hypothetical protein